MPRQVIGGDVGRAGGIEERAKGDGHRHAIDLLYVGVGNVGHVEDDGFGDGGAAAESGWHRHVESGRHGGPA